MLNKSSRSHRRLSKFADWIRPESETRKAIIKQAGEIRDRIKAQAAADDLTVVATPDSGSFAKLTGLRRHMRGGLEIEGQDVDLPFVVRPMTTDGERIDELLRRFGEYAKSSYPDTPRETTGSSVELRFVASKLSYDLVPMLKSQYQDYQIILKKNGTRRLTSVAKHTEFVKARTAASEQLAGPVTFNECVRLLKWWRYVRINEGGGSIAEVRTTLIELLCAAAYDKVGVESTYTATLAKWFAWVAHLARQRIRVKFSDYSSIEPFTESTEQNRLWSVLDPVNENNNVVHSDWTNIQLSEFAEWLERGRDALSRIMAHEQAGRDSEVDRLLEELFGKAVITHGELS
jgi:hypothetical protein